MIRLCLLLSLPIVYVSAWSGISCMRTNTPILSEQSRKEFFNTLGTTGVAGFVTAFTVQQPAFSEDEDVPPVKISDPVGTVVNLPNGVSYTVLKSGTGPAPDRGELVAIRFAAYFGDTKLDDIFETPEPYYTRIGSGGLLKGVEATLPLMQLGDRWKLTIPSDLAFGQKGRPSSAGKPRIPAGATIIFDVEMVGLPGKEVELIELIGD